MIKNLFAICILLTGMSAMAEEVPIAITPLQRISTDDKTLHEGDVVEFKDVKTNEEITGIIEELKPNGFYGEQATLYISNFKYKHSDKPILGSVYLIGGEHKRYQDLTNYGIAPVSVFIRGGEVILKPEKTKLIVFFSDYINSETTPIKIKPAQKISTCFDEIEIGDKINFITAKDVYKNGKLYIEKDTKVEGIVDYVSDNGWASDNAQIDFKTFKTTDVDGKTVTITSPMSINGFEILKYKSNRPAQFFNYCGVVFRGKEVEINPNKDNIEFNIWLNK